MSARIYVWDLPTRLFHWSLVLSVSVAIATGLAGGDWMTIHSYAGIAIVGLVAFRLVWGLAGAAAARFVNFAPTPGRLRAYLAGEWQGHGHNPLGALSVFALLALLAVQAGTGLFGNDEISFQGPLANLVDEARSLQLTGLHQRLAYLLFGLIALHVVAIAVYLLLRKTNLVKPMVTGWKIAAAPARHPVATWHWSALAGAVGVAALAMSLASGAGLAII
jgi:cytochrome b